MPKATTCRSCGATVYWAHDADGRAIMLDPPSDDGYIFAIVRADDSVRVVDARTDETFSCRSHLATCPGH